MTNIDIAFLIANECEQFLEDENARKAYELACEYDCTLDIKTLEEAVRIYNEATGAGLKVNK